MKWIPDPRAEHVVESYGLEAKYVELKASQIDTVASRINHARDKAITAAVAEDYAASMKSGDAFPAIIVCPVKGKKKLVIAGGNHRHEAAVNINKEKTVFALRTEPVDETTFSVLCRELNTVEGRRTDRETRVQQAVDLHFQCGLSMSEAANRMRLSNSAVANGVRARKAELTAESLGKKFSNRTAQASRSLVATYISEEDVFGPLIDTVNQGLSVQETRQLVGELKSLRSEKARTDHLAAYNERRAENGRVSHKSVSRKTRKSFMQSLTALENLTRGKVAAGQLQLDHNELEEVLERWMRLNETVESLLTSST